MNAGGYSALSLLLDHNYCNAISTSHEHLHAAFALDYTCPSFVKQSEHCGSCVNESPKSNQSKSPEFNKLRLLVITIGT